MIQYSNKWKTFQHSLTLLVAVINHVLSCDPCVCVGDDISVLYSAKPEGKKASVTILSQ